MIARRRLHFALQCAALLAFSQIAGPALAEDEPPALAAIPSLDVNRYMGQWYEISKYANRFQRQCVGDTTATYALLPDSSVSVTNRCKTEDGEFDEAVGVAHQIGGPDSAKLEVRFAPEWLGFLPFVWGDYWVIDLDEAYQLVAVAEPKREFLWILSRTPTVNAAAYDALVARLQRQGFEPARLERTPQQSSQ